MRETVSASTNAALIWGEVARKFWRDDGVHDSIIEHLFNNNRFLFDHIGDVYESGSIIFGARALLEMVDFLRQKAGNEKWSPRVKMWTSVLVGMAIPMIIESLGIGVSGNTIGPDYCDAIIGPGISGALVGGSWEFVSFLTDSETALKALALKQKFHDGVVNIGTMIEDRVDLIAASKDRPTSIRISNALDRITLMTETITGKISAIDMDKYSKDLDLELLANRSLQAMAKLFNRSGE